MKRYKAVFFDWDGTAVASRKASAASVIAAMKPLLALGVKLCIISGTTRENIAGGALADGFTVSERRNLFLGLARGAQNWGFDTNGELLLLGGVQPEREGMSRLHEVCFDIHLKLFSSHGYNTDIVFGRPNYCKIDLLSDLDRGDQLFFQASEAARLEAALESKGFCGGLRALIDFAESVGVAHDLAVKVTSDAKYLEVGLSTKRDNVNFLMEHLRLSAGDCCFWGDEFLEISDGVYGSDAAMLTEKSSSADFFDVSEASGKRPDGVRVVGGGTAAFADFLSDLLGTLSLENGI